MKVIGYVRTALSEDVGEQDLEEQERGLAEYCMLNSHELTEVISDNEDQGGEGLAQALKAKADGIVVTDPLVLGECMESVQAFSDALVKHGKHLFVIYENKHIDPAAPEGKQDLLNVCAELLGKRKR